MGKNYLTQKLKIIVSVTGIHKKVILCIVTMFFTLYLSIQYRILQIVFRHCVIGCSSYYTFTEITQN